MKSFSRKASAIHESSTLAVSALANRLKAEGKDVINFGTGEPDFDTPENIKNAAIDAIHAGKTKYTPASGLPALKAAVCKRLEADIGVHYEPSEIVIASGAKHSIYIALCCLLDEGDEVIVPAPYWVTYTESVAMAGGTPVVIATTPEQHFKLTPEALEAAITPKTKLLILNNPSNPTGMCYDEGELRAICDVCVKHDLWIMSDEIYYKLVYDGRKFVSAAALSEEIKAHTIIVNGVSKSYAMTGWRIGYLAAPLWLAKACNKFQGQFTSGPSSISQRAALCALVSDKQFTEEMTVAFRRRRDFVTEGLKKIPGIKLHKPDGAFYVFPDVSAYYGKSDGDITIGNDNDLCMYLLNVAHVATVAGTGFGEPNCIRLSYATSDENLRTAIRSLQESFARLK